MPFNLHKRVLKEQRKIKKKNFNKEQSIRKIGGTGKRYSSFYLYQNNRELDEWAKRHPGQILESSVHDRTKWKSSKAQTVELSFSRKIKLMV